MKPGQSRPSSKLSTVPDTAPTAKRMPKARLQRRASSRQLRSPLQSPRPSTASRSRGRPTPSEAKTMWNPSEVPIWARPERYSVTSKGPPVAQVGGARAGAWSFLGYPSEVGANPGSGSAGRGLGCALQPSPPNLDELASGARHREVIDGSHAEPVRQAFPRRTQHHLKASMGGLVSRRPE